MVLRFLRSRHNRRDALILLAIGALAVLVRLGAALVLRQPLESDALAYFTMAQGLADHGQLLDPFGQHAFYSAGYPLLLAPFFAVLGASVVLALAINGGLALVSLWLVHRLTLTLSKNRLAALVAAGAYALWLPGIWNATVLAKENLSTPLLLALTHCALQTARGTNPARWALWAGALWGASLITGGSTVLSCIAVGVALVQLVRKRGEMGPAFVAGLCFCAGSAILLTPWLYATSQMVGRPVLTTNAAFNLYLGNNPAATGRFVSIADTPMGKDWNHFRTARGEIGTADALKAEAIRWISAHPAGAAQLAGRKLVYFWQPNIPDAADFRASKIVASVRLVEVLQYGAIVLLGLVAFRSSLVDRNEKGIVTAIVVGFWVVHAAAYVIARYRDPVMPLLIVMGAVPVAQWLEARFAGGEGHADGV